MTNQNQILCDDPADDPAALQCEKATQAIQHCMLAWAHLLLYLVGPQLRPAMLLEECASSLIASHSSNLKVYITE